ncbi:hypothetical protein EDD15DRAFT_2261856 [Pisolithus albus]|nr:hypothetical protein EDD15DRAFT_2261856 [Pisolithus albus]
MHFPSLRRLTLRIGNPIPFLEAIVAPKLAFFSFDPREKESISETFTGTRTKFINVSHLDLSEMCEVTQENLQLFQLLCRVFCGIRHADIHVAYLRRFIPDRGPGAIDHCTYIESLDIQNIIPDSVQPFQDLVYGFENRLRLGRRKLHLKLTGKCFLDEVVTVNTSDTFFQRLQECCASVILDGIPVSPQLYLPT